MRLHSVQTSALTTPVNSSHPDRSYSVLLQHSRSYKRLDILDEMYPLNSLLSSPRSRLHAESVQDFAPSRRRFLPPTSGDIERPRNATPTSHRLRGTPPGCRASSSDSSLGGRGLSQSIVSLVHVLTIVLVPSQASIQQTVHDRLKDCNIFSGKAKVSC